jgi:aspartate aminotransferase
MLEATSRAVEFGDAALVDASLSERVRGLIGSEILKIAAEIREIVASGKPVCNLTVGDFSSRQFPIPEPLLDAIQRALRAGETNYPPSDGVLRLRKAVLEYVEREHGLRFPLESILIAGGARPILYGAYRCVLDPGDTVVYPVPSWNNNHYAWITGATKVEIETRAADGFQPTLAELTPHFAGASLIVINSPLNPTGTILSPEELRRILEALVDENRKRRSAGRKELFLVHDQVYGSLVFGGKRHVHPVSIVPESAPWVISLDGVSKAFAGTGLRVGWLMAAPPVTARMRDLLGHVGAWAPRAEQVAVAEFLSDADAVASFRADMNARVKARLDALYGGFTRLKEKGLSVDCIDPQGAIYLSLRLDLAGRALDGTRIASNEDIRKLLLEHAGLAVVPFQAFGLKEDSGWFRLSVGAVSLEEIELVFPRVESLLGRLSR